MGVQSPGPPPACSPFSHAAPVPTRPTDPGDALDADGHLLAAVDDDHRSAVVLRLARRAGQASVHLAVLRAGELPMVLAESGVPATTDRWEFRSSGLWVEAVCERPEAHWSYGLECFALAIDHPHELLERGYGHRSPLGWELDFEAADGAPEARGSALQAGRVDGLVLTGPGPDGERPLAGPAVRGAWVAPGHPEPDRWPLDLPAVVGPPVEVALPLDGDGVAGPVWWVGHDGHRLTAGVRDLRPS